MKHGLVVDVADMLVQDEPILYFQQAVFVAAGLVIQTLPVLPPLHDTLVTDGVAWNMVHEQQQLTGLTFVTIELDVPVTVPNRFIPDGPPRLTTLISMVWVPAHKYRVNVKLWKTVKFDVHPCCATGVMVGGTVISTPSI